MSVNTPAPWSMETGTDVQRTASMPSYGSTTHQEKSSPAENFSEATTEHSTETLQWAIEHASLYHATIRQVNTDRGAQFYSNKKKPSRFEQFLTSQGIQFIPSRKQNLQTNGKLERH